jgi:hypothetical protein
MLPDPLKLGNVAPDILSSNGLGLVVKILVECDYYTHFQMMRLIQRRLPLPLLDLVECDYYTHFQMMTLIQCRLPFPLLDHLPHFQMLHSVYINKSLTIVCLKFPTDIK